jgi:hypothetical protein
MAALLFSIAPDLSLHSVSVRQNPAEALQTLALMDLDLVLCAWGVAREAEIDAATIALQPRLIAAGEPAYPCAPAAVPGTTAITPQTPWPKGPFGFGEGGGSYAGLSVASAIACGLAALLLCAGVPRARALHAVSTPPATDPVKVLYLLT